MSYKHRKTFKHIVDEVKEESTQRHKNKKQIVKILPRNIAQEEYLTYLSNPNKRIIFAIGSAGTGKTLMAVLQAIKQYKEGTTDKIIICRPSITVDDEKFGFLPGDLNQKLEPWTKPIFDIFEEYYNKAEIQKMVLEGDIEVCPFAFLRGRTLKNAIIIADESQNTSVEQMKVLLTRIGENTRVIITGDMNQTDRRGENGLEDFIRRLEGTNTRNLLFVSLTNHTLNVIRLLVKYYQFTAKIESMSIFVPKGYHLIPLGILL